MEFNSLTILNVTVPVTVRVTPGLPEYFPLVWSVNNLNLYVAESLSLRSLIFRVQSFFLSPWYSRRPAYSGSWPRLLGSIPVPHSVNQCCFDFTSGICVRAGQLHCWPLQGTDPLRGVSHTPSFLTQYHWNTVTQGYYMKSIFCCHSYEWKSIDKHHSVSCER
jgi:hypothetical protein